MESKYDYVVFDIETTGLHPDSDQICEIAAIGVKDGLPQGTFSTLVAIEGSMPEAAGRVANVEENRFDQLIEVEQDGKVIGSYKGLKPGEKLDEIDVTGAKPGAATVTVQAMEDGEPSGNPSGFEVTITASE